MSGTASVPSYLPFELEVTAVRRLSPHFTRITLGGTDLMDMDDGGSLGTRDTRVKVVIPAGPGRTFADVDMTRPDWYRAWLALDPSLRGHVRTYTARSARLSATVPELDIDFVIHVDDDGGGGPATLWAANARLGHRLTVIAPNRHYGEVTGMEWKPPTAGDGRQVQVLLAGDETAAPAIAAILETLPDQYTGDALVEVPTAADIQELKAPRDVTVTVLSRDDRPRGERLKTAVESIVARLAPDACCAPDVPPVDVDSDIMWETPQPESPTGTSAASVFYAWVAGEAAVVRDIRRSLIGDHGISRERVAFMGYWRQGRAEG
ncbi:MAG: sialic acid transporter [Nocardioidaceae bacterium]|nr:sialic acid transporter [Nocardioidaceae bacterium]